MKALLKKAACAAMIAALLCPALAAGASANFGYDDLHRLIRVDFGGDYYIEYAYDDAGNRLERGPRINAGLDHIVNTLKMLAGATYDPTKLVPDLNKDGKRDLAEAALTLRDMAND